MAKVNYNSEYNKKEYEKKNFKYQNVCFKVEEMDEIEEFCKLWGMPKNTLIRSAVMEYIRKPVVGDGVIERLEK